MGLIGLLKYFRGIYSVNKYYHKLVSEYFNRIHLRDIVAKINKHYKISKYTDLVNIINESPFKGLINSLFLFNNSYPSPLDIATSIRISTHEYDNNSKVYDKAIIDASYHIFREMKERIQNSSLLLDLFNSSGKKLELLNYDIPRKQIEDALQDKKSLFINYFKSFEDKNFSTFIKIWHQGEGQEWIDWDEKNSLQIHLDLTKIREGFFIVGFDYSINGLERLDLATRKNGFEYYNNSKTLKNEELIWLR